MSTRANQHHGPHPNGADQKPAPYWKRAHHSWIFWVGLVLAFAAILIYVLSLDLAWRPRVRTVQPAQSGTVGK